MDEIVQLAIGLKSDIYKLGLLVFPLVVTVRLLMSSIQKGIGVGDAVILAWRDTFIALMSILLLWVFITFVERLLFVQTSAQWYILK